jgi:hypothetical protein
MLSWWHRDVIAAGKLPLMLCFVSFVVTFVSTRTITRLIRDGRGPFRNVTAGGTHVHHSVPGIILLMIGAFTAVGGPGTLGWLSFSAIAIGIGTSLVLDEFALILHLQDGAADFDRHWKPVQADWEDFIGGRPSQPDPPPSPEPEAVGPADG